MDWMKWNGSWWKDDQGYWHKYQNYQAHQSWQDWYDWSQWLPQQGWSGDGHGAGQGWSGHGHGTMVAFRVGLSADEFQDDDPWEGPRGKTAEGVTSAGVPSTVKDKILKMSALIDQADESELVPTSDEVDGWLQNYVNVMGAPPEEEEEPTAAQLAALRKKIQAGGAPYTDFRCLAAL